MVRPTSMSSLASMATASPSFLIAPMESTTWLYEHLWGYIYIYLFYPNPTKPHCHWIWRATRVVSCVVTAMPDCTLFLSLLFQITNTCFGLIGHQSSTEWCRNFIDQKSLMQWGNRTRVPRMRGRYSTIILTIPLSIKVDLTTTTNRTQITMHSNEYNSIARINTSD